MVYLKLKKNVCIKYLICFFLRKFICYIITSLYDPMEWSSNHKCQPIKNSPRAGAET